MTRPGAHGPHCDQLAPFDVPSSELSMLNLSAHVPSRYTSGQTGSRGLRCLGIRMVIQRTRQAMQGWVRDATKPGKLARKRTSSRCFGCLDRGGCCRGQGVCLHGWCACEHGFYGIDCAHGPGHQHDHTPVRNGLSIFIYEVPPELSFRFGRHINPNYQSERRFLDRLLPDGNARTLDPESADLFLVPFFDTYGPAENRFCDRARFEMIVHWLRARHPYWDRSGGRDHVFFLNGDRGACGFGTAGLSPIFVSHFGLLGTFRTMKESAERVVARKKLELEENETKLGRKMTSGAWCYSPHKDIVAPPYLPAPPVLPSASDRRGRASRLLVHAGGIWGALTDKPGLERPTYYSMGVRQRLYEIYGTGGSSPVPAICILNSSVGGRSATLKFMQSSDFCLATCGDGWGMRWSQSMLAGCLPLIAQPLVVQPLEDVLDFDAFSRRVEAHKLEELPQVLSRDDEVTVRHMHDVQSQVRAAFSWDPAVGLAYNYTLLALCQRAMELRGRLKGGGNCAQIHDGLPGASLMRRMPSWFPPALRKAVTRSIEARRASFAQNYIA